MPPQLGPKQTMIQKGRNCRSDERITIRRDDEKMVVISNWYAEPPFRNLSHAIGENSQLNGG